VFKIVCRGQTNEMSMGSGIHGLSQNRLASVGSDPFAGGGEKTVF
jgi:hypothetical protein